MNLILDSNIFIAAWHTKDVRADKAIELIARISEDDAIKHVFITNYILIEITNFLSKKLPFEIVKDIFSYLTGADKIRIVYVDTLMENIIDDLFLGFKGRLSLVDCSLVVLAQELGISAIYSFDSGFDIVRGITRLEGPN